MHRDGNLCHKVGGANDAAPTRAVLFRSIFNVLHCHTNTAITLYQAFASLSRFGWQYPDKTQHIPTRMDTRVFVFFQAQQTKAREYQESDTVLRHRDVGLRKQLTARCLLNRSNKSIFASHHWKRSSFASRLSS